jgi:hypothetical protein
MFICLTVRESVWFVSQGWFEIALSGPLSWTTLRCSETGQSQSQSYFIADGQSVSSSWCRAQSGTFDQRYYFFLFFFFKLQSCLNWGALSDERSGLSFVSLQSVYSSIYITYLYIVLYTFDINNIYLVLDTFTIKTIKYDMYNIYRPRSVQALQSRLCPSYK